MSKLAREALAHYIKPAALSSAWHLIGKDVEDMSVDMNGSFESRKNILGETSVSDTGYSPSFSVSPYYADPSDGIYEFLRDLALGRKSGDDAKATMLEVIIEDTADESHLAYQEDCVIEITSYGGNTEGFGIEYVVHPNGNRKKGTVTITGKQPTFVEG